MTPKTKLNSLSIRPAHVAVCTFRYLSISLSSYRNRNRSERILTALREGQVFGGDRA